MSVVPALTEDVRTVLLRLARLIPLSPEEQDRLLQRARRQPRNAALVVNAELTFEQLAAIGLNLPQLPGVQTDITWKRRTFHGNDMGMITGFVGAIERPALDDDPVVRLPGMRVGKSGVERAMEQKLRGQGGVIKQELDARGRIVRTLSHTEPQRGADVQITVDVALQGQVMTRLRQERRAAVVAIDVVTGEVLTMASQPTEDASDLASADWQRLEATPDNPLLNRCIQGLYPPGSTFKIVTALAALDAGRITLKERLDCQGEYQYADQTYRCWQRRGHGRCDLHRALRESCDCYFYELARRTGIDAIAAMARRLGLGQTWECGIALQRTGLVPTPDWKRARFGKPWHGGETILAGIGQGFLTATPFQLAVMTSRVATGLSVVPTLIRAPGDRMVSPAASLELSPAWLDAVRRGLWGCVNEDGGTGRNAQMQSSELDHIKVAGKTGTSQVNRASTDRATSELKWEERDHSLFVAYAPAERPRIAIAAVVEHGGSGGSVAAPLARDVLELVLRRELHRGPVLTPRGNPLGRPT